VLIGIEKHVPEPVSQQFMPPFIGAGQLVWQSLSVLQVAMQPPPPPPLLDVLAPPPPPLLEYPPLLALPLPPESSPPNEVASGPASETNP
jgi:hypothetical protein